MLVANNYSVTRLNGSNDVLETLGTHQYEVALVNAKLPDMTWRSTFRAIKSLSRTTVVIMITQSADERDIRLALNAGSYIVLTRPVTQRQLTDLICSRGDGLLVVLR